MGHGLMVLRATGCWGVERTVKSQRSWAELVGKPREEPPQSPLLWRRPLSSSRHLVPLGGEEGVASVEPLGIKTGSPWGCYWKWWGREREGGGQGGGDQPQRRFPLCLQVKLVTSFPPPVREQLQWVQSRHSWVHAVPGYQGLHLLIRHQGCLSVGSGSGSSAAAGTGG